MAASGQNSSQSQFITSDTRGNLSGPTEPLIDSVDVDQIVISETESWKNFFAYLGPGFLVSIAYIDPGNFETDLQSGAQYKYELLWIILVASFAALIIQSLAARLGVVTGKHLAEHCRAEYPKILNFILWLLAELAVVACDIPEGLLASEEDSTEKDGDSNDAIESNFADCILRCKSVFKCRLCPRIVCLSEDSVKVHLNSKCFHSSNSFTSIYCTFFNFKGPTHGRVVHIV